MLACVGLYCLELASFACVGLDWVVLVSFAFFGSCWLVLANFDSYSVVLDCVGWCRLGLSFIVLLFIVGLYCFCWFAGVDVCYLCLIMLLVLANVELVLTSIGLCWLVLDCIVLSWIVLASVCFCLLVLTCNAFMAWVVLCSLVLSCFG